LSNLNTYNPVTANIQNPTNNLTGFIYHTYRAAQRENHKDRLLNKRSNQQEEAYVSSSVGGSLSQISFQGNDTKNRTYTTHVGGIKGKVRGFSRVSRRNLLRRFASIHRTAFRAYKGRVFSLTLTYPHVFPEDPEVCKRHLKALYRKRGSPILVPVL
jgi:hypothetical protein